MRIRALNSADIDPRGRHVLYWMIAARRLRSNFGLQRAAELAREQGVPLVVLEALRCGYRWASDRHHAFVIDGMREHEAALSGSNVLYYPYVEPEAGAGKGLLEALAAGAAAVVTDDFPCFFLPRMTRAAAGRLPVRLETVDSNGLLPLAAAERVFVSAYQFRRFLQKELRPHLEVSPEADPLQGSLVAAGELPGDIRRRWPRARLSGGMDLSSLPIDHGVAPAPCKGGHAAATGALRSFQERIGGYAENCNHPDDEATSGLSPWLHFGHISVHEVLDAVAPDHGFPARQDGRRGGWGVDESVEEFLDQLVTWRELGLNFCHKREDYDRYESLPDWARQTLEQHAADTRDPVYLREELEASETHDTLWNAAQNQLVLEGRLHNYLRMLWGKKILEWSATPRQALDVMIELNNKYGLDGRDPNSYSGIFWVLGRYDRAWGPERPIFGKVRYMSSDSARRKLRLAEFESRYG